jgi:hypothetical protein
MKVRVFSITGVIKMEIWVLKRSNLNSKSYKRVGISNAMDHFDNFLIQRDL